MTFKNSFKGSTLLLTLLLSSCTFGLSSNDSALHSSQGTPASEVTSLPESEGGFYTPTSHRYDNRAVASSWGGEPLSSTGDQKMLVVPIVFKDTSSKALATATYKNALTKTFFGTSNETGWESVASFYEKSSFGNLRLSGEVTDFFNLNKTIAELQSISGYDEQTYYVLEQIYAAFSSEKLREYDTDGDGYVDAIWLVYMAPIVTDDDESIYWAYQTYYEAAPNVTKPNFNVYAWASYTFMNEGDGYSYNKPDAHTFIHESGHVMSLNDYYDYSGKSAPAGGVDMMDYNVTDHNSYSKFALNWVQPYVVTDSATITLTSTTETGNFILINDNWNGHAYDEYIIIEFYTPTGLNLEDITSSYKPDGFSVNGVRMYHIDSRLMSVRNRTKTFVDEIISNETTYTDIAISNSQSSSWHLEGNFNHKQVHLLNAAGTNNDWFNRNRTATNSALFQSGAKIGADEWITYLKVSNNFNDGSVIGYSIEIGAMTSDAVQIIITKA